MTHSVMNMGYSTGNAASRRKLAEILHRLAEADYGKTTGAAGWTIGGVLGHLAFWDLRAQDGIGGSAADPDILNEAMRPILNALSPGEAARLALESARAIDAAIDSLDPSFLARVEAEGAPVRLNRETHREHHLAQIEKALG